MTRFIDELEYKGFIVRSKGGEHDLRLIAIHPTRQASVIRVQLEEQEDKLYQHLCTTLGEQQVKALVRLSRQAIDKL